MQRCSRSVQVRIGSLCASLLPPLPPTTSADIASAAAALADAACVFDSAFVELSGARSRYTLRPASTRRVGMASS